VLATPHAIRDRAVLVAGFCTGLRSASLVELELGDIEFERRGAIVRVRREKNDQAGRGRVVGLVHGKHPETCPVRALREWIETRGDFAGALFCHVRRGKKARAVNRSLTPETIGVIVKKRLVQIGVDPTGYSSHSLRSGIVTAAGENNISELIIARTTGHRDLSMVRMYFRRRDAFHASLSSLLDL
jgi:integrase